MNCEKSIPLAVLCENTANEIAEIAQDTSDFQETLNSLSSLFDTIDATAVVSLQSIDAIQQKMEGLAGAITIIIQHIDGSRTTRVPVSKIHEKVILDSLAYRLMSNYSPERLQCNAGDVTFF